MNQMKLFTKGRVVGMVIVLAVAGLLWGGYALQKKIGAPDDKPRYKTADVDRGSIVQFVTATGTLNPVGLVNVGTQVSGTVSEVKWTSMTASSSVRCCSKLSPPCCRLLSSKTWLR